MQGGVICVGMKFALSIFNNMSQALILTTPLKKLYQSPAPVHPTVKRRFHNIRLSVYIAII